MSRPPRCSTGSPSHFLASSFQPRLTTHHHLMISAGSEKSLTVSFLIDLRLLTALRCTFPQPCGECLSFLFGWTRSGDLTTTLSRPIQSLMSRPNSVPARPRGSGGLGVSGSPQAGCVARMLLSAHDFFRSSGAFTNSVWHLINCLVFVLSQICILYILQCDFGGDSYSRLHCHSCVKSL